MAKIALKPMAWIGSKAQTPIGWYSVDRDFDDEINATPWACWSPSELINHFSTLPEAKAAAQADYEARIMAAIETTSKEASMTEQEILNHVKSFGWHYFWGIEKDLPDWLKITSEQGAEDVLLVNGVRVVDHRLPDGLGDATKKEIFRLFNLAAAADRAFYDELENDYQEQLRKDKEALNELEQRLSSPLHEGATMTDFDTADKTRAAIEARYQLDMQNAKEVYDSLVRAAEELRGTSLAKAAIDEARMFRDGPYEDKP